jgi:hypothetical protein
LSLALPAPSAMEKASGEDVVLEDEITEFIFDDDVLK